MMQYYTFGQHFNTTDKYREIYENEPNLTFLTLAMTFRVIQSNPSLHSSSSLSLEAFLRLALPPPPPLNLAQRS